MKKLLFIPFIFLSLAGYAQVNLFGGIGSRVLDSATYRASSAVTAAHTNGYKDIYFNAQATTPHWDIWNGSTYDHVFSFGSGGSETTAWGNIPGTLSDQTDLQTALDAKEDLLETVSVATAGATITLNFDNDTQKIFVGDATFATGKAVAFSNATNGQVFSFHFEVTNVAGTLNFPANVQMFDEGWDVGTTTWTPPATGEYEIAGSYDGTNWRIKRIGPYDTTPTSGTPGGADTQVQYNDGGAFNGEADFTYNETTNTVTVDNAAVDTEAYDATGWDSDLTVPTKDATRDKIETLAPIASPTFTGTPAAPTAAAHTSTTQLATTEFVGLSTGRIFNVESYGALHDYQTVSDANVSSGTATLTSATAAFTSDDTGKTIRVFGAGAAGADLITTITYVNSTTVTLGTNASTTITDKQIEWGTDDTAAIQSAITACNAAGGGIVFFPSGIYLIAGALITSLDSVNPNCQLYFPLTQAGSTTKTIRLLGEQPASQFGGILTASTPTNEGVILKSIIIGTGTNPSVIASSWYDDGFGFGYNYTQCEFENIRIRVKSKTGTAHVAPTMSAFNGRRFSKMVAVECVADTESGPTDSAEPASNVTGFATPTQSNGALSYLERCNAKNYYKNFELSEHSFGHELRADAGYYNFFFDFIDGVHHGCYLSKVYGNGGKYNVAFGVTLSKLVIDLVIFERYPGSYGTKWYDGVSDFYAVSGSSVVNGYINALTTISGGTATPISISSNITRASINDLTYTAQVSNFGRPRPGTSSQSTGLVGGDATADAAILEINRNRSTSSDQYYSQLLLSHGGQTSTAGLVGQMAFVNYGSSNADKRQGIITVRTNGSAQKSLMNFTVHDGSALAANVFQITSDWVKTALPVVVDNDITPTQLAANTDNWAPTGIGTAATVRVSTDASRELTGIAAGTSMVDGRELTLINVGAQNLVLKNNVTSTAANRFLLGADITVTPEQAVRLVYDATASRWRKLF